MSRISVLDHGHVDLVKVCAEDLDVVNAARVSFNSESSELDDAGKGLIKFLMRERHGTPFEHTFFKFRIKAPIFVFREWHRHRVGHSYNEWSGRYSQLAPEFYVPDVVLEQKGKPGAYTFEETNESSAEQYKNWLRDSSNLAYQLYEQSLELGVSKQQARGFLPVFTYSEMIWSCNSRSLMHFLGLRNSEQAQMEIREYARVVELLFSEHMPVTHQAFIDNGRTAP
jgi:thymidylate synthase (FAD)